MVLKKVVVDVDWGPATIALSNLADCMGKYIDRLKEVLPPDQYVSLQQDVYPQLRDVSEAFTNLKKANHKD